jgi:hypothetical protein
VSSPIEVEGVHHVGVHPEVVLGATLRGEVLVVATVLGDLKCNKYQIQSSEMF